jgi:hypothetical protein
MELKSYNKKVEWEGSFNIWILCCAINHSYEEKVKVLKSSMSQND